MQTTTNAQMGLLDSLMIATSTNEFLERLDPTFDWKPIEAALQAMYPATTGRPRVHHWRSGEFLEGIRRKNGICVLKSHH
jgi:hypothetical protein